LHHLLSLYLFLEMRGGEDPLAQVALAYRDPLPLEAEDAIKKALTESAIDVFLFLPIMREFCTEQLSSATWPSGSNLKEYVGYSTEVALETLDWYQSIPDSLELRHSYATYHLLSSGGG
jgi:hypothetical protein